MAEVERAGGAVPGENPEAAGVPGDAALQLGAGEFGAGEFGAGESGAGESGGCSRGSSGRGGCGRGRGRGLCRCRCGAGHGSGLSSRGWCVEDGPAGERRCASSPCPRRTRAAKRAVHVERPWIRADAVAAPMRSATSFGTGRRSWAECSGHRPGGEEVAQEHSRALSTPRCHPSATHRGHSYATHRGHSSATHRSRTRTPRKGGRREQATWNRWERGPVVGCSSMFNQISAEASAPRNP